MRQCNTVLPLQARLRAQLDMSLFALWQCYLKDAKHGSRLLLSVAHTLPTPRVWGWHRGGRGGEGSEK